jgi:hypothetical protein
MEMQNIVIFALIGAVCMFIVTGGVLSMTSDIDPSPTNLAAGATVGGALGAAASYVLGNSESILKGGALDLSSFGSSGPEMKVGLPSF